jgi:hypothetical protein
MTFLDLPIRPPQPVQPAVRENRVRACAQTLASEITAEEMESLKKAMALLQQRDPAAPLSPYLEVGTAAGGTLVQVMGMFATDRRPRFVVVDPMTYFPDQLGVVQRNIRDHGFAPQEVDFWIGQSKRIYPQLAGIGQTLGCVFIDGEHSIRGLTYDLNWAKLLRIGGLLIFHDYFPIASPEVVSVVNRFLKRCPNYQRISWVNSLLILEKASPSTNPEVSSIEVMRAELLHPVLRLRRSVRKRLTRFGLR